MKIQAFYRRYVDKGVHLDMWFERNRRPRLLACILIQSHMRRFLRSRFMAAVRAKKNRAALFIQRVYRGFRCRKRLRISWAARRIQRFMKTLHFFKFKDSVIMVMQLRIMARKQHRLATRIQRVYRGHSTRVWVFNKRLWHFICILSARRIQRCYRRAKARWSMVPHVYPGEEWARRQCARRLARMILELYLDRARRGELAALMQQSAPSVQRLVRGFLAKSGAKKMVFLRQSLRNWFRPQFAGQFMQRFLASKLTHFKQAGDPGAEPSRPFVFREKACIVRAHLPERHRNRFEVDYRVFEAALAAWYHSRGLPLVLSEMQSIKRKFRNPMVRRRCIVISLPVS